MDRETEGQHAERPQPSNSISAHTAKLATSTKTCTMFSTEILGLQRRTICAGLELEHRIPMWLYCV